MSRKVPVFPEFWSFGFGLFNVKSEITAPEKYGLFGTCFTVLSAQEILVVFHSCEKNLPGILNALLLSEPIFSFPFSIMPFTTFVPYQKRDLIMPFRIRKFWIRKTGSRNIECPTIKWTNFLISISSQMEINYTLVFTNYCHPS